jgi:glycosyltransferase involved in cell wall biosynthesis
MTISAPVRRKINILFIIMQMEMGGSERLVHSLVKRIDRNRFNPSVAWFYGETPLDEYQALGVPLFHVPKIKRFDPGTLQQLANIIHREEIHVVNAHHFMSMIYASWGCRRHGAKLIYTEHSAWEIERLARKWRMIGRILQHMAMGAVGVSPKVSAALQRIFKIPSHKLHTIQNGVDLESFTQDADRDLVRRELGLSPRHQVIGMVANLKKVKNQLFLLRAFAALSRKHQDARLVFIGKSVLDGDGDMEQEIRAFIKDHDLHEKVLLLGFRSDVARLLTTMDIFCLTSLKEGLPIGMLEAMAAGCPAVGTDVEGIRDVIINEQNGLLVPLESVDSLKAALERLIEDAALRIKMGNAARATAISSYSLVACVRAYETVFSQAR